MTDKLMSIKLHVGVMKKTTLTGLAALCLVDISAATPVVAQRTNPFTGAYAGVHTGFFSGDATFNSPSYTITTPLLGTVPGRSDSFDIDGLLAGVHGGFNALFGNNFIIGLEGDWTYLGGDDSVSKPTTVIGADGLSFQYRSELEYDWQSTIRGRFGFVSGNTLFLGPIPLTYGSRLPICKIWRADQCRSKLPFVNSSRCFPTMMRV